MIFNKPKLPTEYLDELRQIAIANGGRLLSTEWKGALEKYEFQFEDGTQFFIIANNLKKRGWPNIHTFLKNDLDRLQELKETAYNNKGKLISSEWIGYHKSYEFAFEDGTHFFMTPSNLTRKGWPINHFYNLKIAATENNCKLISPKWLGSQEKHLFQLEDGRTFEMLPSQLKHNFPKNRENIFKSPEDYLEELKTLAEKEGGKLISKQWFGSKYQYDFEFQDGTPFSRSATSMKTGGWPKDINLFLNLQISQAKNDDDFLSEMSSIAIERKGQLLSKKWDKNSSKYTFEDNHGIVFECSYSALKGGAWTPDRGLISEPICRQIFNHLFNTEFIKTKKVLTSKIINRKMPLELDGYSKELNIAFEYQGHPSHWNENNKSFIETSNRDFLKKDYCQKLGILLIQIPSFDSKKTKNNCDIFLKLVVEQIRETYLKNNMKLPMLNMNNFQVDFSKINHSNEMLEKLNIIAQDNDSKLLSTEWRGASEKYKFQLSDKRILNVSASYLFSNGWVKNPDKSILLPEDYLLKLANIALRNNGKLLSTEWNGPSEKYEFQFEDGRKFKMSASNIRRRWPQNPDLYIKLNESYIKRNNRKI